MKTPSEIAKQKRAEAQNLYDALTDRILALDTDIANEIDSEKVQTLENRRSELSLRRDAVTVELAGDVMTDVARTHIPGYPVERRIHDAEDRLDDHETRIAHIEHSIRPPWQVTAWRLMAVIIAVLGVVLFVVPETHAVMFDLYPPFGFGALGFLATMSALLWRMGAVTLERQQ